MLGTTEIIVIGGVVVLLFGASAIPKFARSLGKAKKEFKEGVNEGLEEQKEGDK
ncbi:MAG: twin-arginine translocase TatA/TatE family subunit [Spirochaetales bacterium]|uniref:Twin-arginine translocase TatA/TatE family subunit n=1 Tax=Candidatus Thalassospirochaeta sargassi TaxID=3119039 RepID=A0AAJ1I9N0_9SPIO|nr:twin-arginine translocase TatA/TatE family subunit [Spirochaetales bacterium]